MLIDTHCHLDLLDNSQVKYQNAHDAGVQTIIIPSINSYSLQVITKLSQNLDNVFYAVGIYPTELKDLDKQVIEIDFILKNKPNKLVAIGECGLDFSIPVVETARKLSLRNQQTLLFQKHIDWAIQYQLPLIIHNRKASQKILDMIIKYPKLTGVMHCFCQKKAIARQILNQTDFYLGLGGLITTDQGLAEIVKEIPLDRIVLETDAPYLTPKEAKNLSEINEPANLIYTAQKLAKIKNITIDEVANVTNINASRLFKLIN